jgi:hypothetical protein
MRPLALKRTNRTHITIQSQITDTMTLWPCDISEAYLHLLARPTVSDTAGEIDRGRRMRLLIVYACDPPLGSEGIKLVGRAGALQGRSSRALS